MTELDLYKLGMIALGDKAKLVSGYRNINFANVPVGISGIVRIKIRKQEPNIRPHRDQFEGHTATLAFYIRVLGIVKE